MEGSGLSVLDLRSTQDARFKAMVLLLSKLVKNCRAFIWRSELFLHQIKLQQFMHFFEGHFERQCIEK